MGVRGFQQFFADERIVSRMALDDAAKLLVGLLALVIVLPFVVMALVMPFGATMMGTAYGYHTGGWFGLFAVVPLLLLVLLGWLGYRLLTDEDSEDQALETLRVAYARGDITTEEFEERSKRLRGDAVRDDA